MIEAGQNLALGAEAGEDAIGVHAALHQFDSNLLLILVVGANGEIDSAHAASAYLADDAIRTEALALDGRGAVGNHGLGGTANCAGHEAVRLLACGDEAFDFLLQLGVAVAGLIEKRASLL